MGDELPDWRTTVHPVYLRYKDDDDVSGTRYYPCIRRREDEEKISAEEEYRLLKEQVEDSKGLDIDFAKFRCVFNYQPLDLDDNDVVLGPETTREFIDRMSRKFP